jgi:hypothetical protein
MEHAVSTKTARGGKYFDPKKGFFENHIKPLGAPIKEAAIDYFKEEVRRRIAGEQGQLSQLKSILRAKPSRNFTPYEAPKTRRQELETVRRNVFGIERKSSGNLSEATERMHSAPVPNVYRRSGTDEPIIREAVSSDFESKRPKTYYFHEPALLPALEDIPKKDIIFDIEREAQERLNRGEVPNIDFKVPKEIVSLSPSSPIYKTLEKAVQKSNRAYQRHGILDPPRYAVPKKKVTLTKSTPPILPPHPPRGGAKQKGWKGLWMDYRDDLKPILDIGLQIPSSMLIKKSKNKRKMVDEGIRQEITGRGKVSDFFNKHKKAIGLATGALALGTAVAGATLGANKSSINKNLPIVPITDESYKGSFDSSLWGGKGPNTLEKGKMAISNFVKKHKGKLTEAKNKLSEAGEFINKNKGKIAAGTFGLALLGAIGDDIRINLADKAIQRENYARYGYGKKKCGKGKVSDFLNKHKGKIALGTAALGLTAAIAHNVKTNLEDRAIERENYARYGYGKKRVTKN